LEEFTIRKATEKDLPMVIAINRKCLPENYPEWFFLQHLRNWGDAFLVAVYKGIVVVGYVMSRAEWGPGIFSKGLTRKGHIISLAVLPRYRRRGLGTRLMEKALDALHRVYGCTEVYLEVRVSNTPAIKLYEKLGFKKVSVLKRYYADGEDAYLMAKQLN